MKTFDIELAIEDKGVCIRQRVWCADCPVGAYLKRPQKDELCRHQDVLALALLVRELNQGEKI